MERWKDGRKVPGERSKEGMERELRGIKQSLSLVYISSSGMREDKIYEILILHAWTLYWKVLMLNNVSIKLLHVMNMINYEYIL